MREASEAGGEETEKEAQEKKHDGNASLMPFF
jgi:hypothetical protein